MPHFLSLKFSHPNFPSSQTLQFFREDKPAQKIALVFGRNGTGKTTVSNAFSQLAPASDDNEDNAELIFAQNNKKHHSDKIIHVFNEEYIKTHIETRSEGLSTITLFGEQAEIESQIQKVESQLEGRQKSASKLSDSIAQIKESLQQQEGTLRKELKSGWRERASQYKPNKPNITETVIKSIYSTTPTEEPTEELREDLLDSTKEYNTAKNNNHRVDQLITPYPATQPRYEEINNCLSKQITTSSNESDAERIRSLIEKGLKPVLEASAKWFTSAEHSYCPSCLRDVTPATAQNISKTIETAIKETDGDLIEKIQSCQLPNIKVEISEDHKLFLTPQHQLAIEETLTNINKWRDEVNNLLEAKSKNPFAYINGNQVLASLKEAEGRLKQLLSKAEQSRAKWNERVSQLDKQEEQLDQLNQQIARNESSSTIKQIEVLEARLNKEKSKQSANNEQIAVLEEDLNKLRIKQRRVDIAEADINRFLEGVFFSPDRLRIKSVSDDEQTLYKVMVRGNDIQPTQLSTGERNMLALAYYFAHAYEEKAHDDRHKKEYLFVIDDPITSIDQENKIGLLTFLSYELTNFMRGNNYTQTIILSHDYSILRSLSSLFGSGKDAKDEGPVRIFELKRPKTDGETRLELDRIGPNDRDEYFTLMQNLYYFGTLDPSQEDLQETAQFMGIGNQARRFLEAYSQFMHGCTYDSLLDQVSPSLINDPQRQQYQSLLNRLFLNSTSHGTDSSYGTEFSNWSNIVSPEELQNLVRRALTLVWTINSNHIVSRLKNHSITGLKRNENDIVETLERWSA